MTGLKGPVLLIMIGILISKVVFWAVEGCSKHNTEQDLLKKPKTEL